MLSKASARSLRALRGPALAVLLLSLLRALGTLLSGLLPSLVPTPLPPLERQAIPLGIVAITAIAWGVFRRTNPPSRALMLRSILIGLGLFAAPALLVFAASAWVGDLARTALFALTPVFAVVFEPSFPESRIGELGLASQDRTAQRRIPGALASALAALAGALLVFPVSLPESLPAALAFAAVIAASACVAAANCAAVSSARSTAASLAAACGASAAVLLAASCVFESPVFTPFALLPQLLWTTLIEAPPLALLFWLLPRVSATRLSTRFLIAPAAAVLTGSLLLRSPLVPRTWLGLALMAGGAAWLLLARPVADDAGPPSLHLR